MTTVLQTERHRLQHLEHQCSNNALWQLCTSAVISLYLPLPVIMKNNTWHLFMDHCVGRPSGLDIFSGKFLPHFARKASAIHTADARSP